MKETLVMDGNLDNSQKPNPSRSQLNSKPAAKEVREAKLLIANYFKKVVIERKHRHQCTRCPIHISDCKNTSNLHQHFSKHHQALHKTEFSEWYETLS